MVEKVAGKNTETNAKQTTKTGNRIQLSLEEYKALKEKSAKKHKEIQMPKPLKMALAIPALIIAAICVLYVLYQISFIFR